MKQQGLIERSFFLSVFFCLISKYALMAALLATVASLTPSASAGWSTDSYTFTTNRSSTVSSNNYPWSIYQNSSDSCTVSSSTFHFGISGSAMTTNNVTLTEDTNNGGYDLINYADNNGHVTFVYDGPPGDAPSTDAETSESGSGHMIIGGGIHYSVENLIAVAWSTASASSTVGLSFTSNVDGTIAGMSSTNASGYDTSFTGTYSNNSYTYAADCDGLGYTYGGSTDYSFSTTGDYYTTAGTGTVTANCDLKCHSESYMESDDPLRSWGSAISSASSTGSASLSLLE